MTTEPEDPDVEVRVQRRFAKLDTAETARAAGIARSARSADDPPRRAGRLGRLTASPEPTAPASAPDDAPAEVATVQQALEQAVRDAVQQTVPAAVQQALQQAAGELVQPAVRTAVSGVTARVIGHVDNHLEVLRGELEAAFEEVVGRVAATDRAVQAVQAMQVEQADRAEREPGRAPEPAPIAPALAALDEKVNAVGRLLEAQAADLARMVHALHTTRDDGTEVDMAHLEDVVGRGTVANAADIANLRTDVEVLAAALREQTAALTELRKHVAWIRQRLLSH